VARIWPLRVATRLWARLRRFSFDRALAEGADPCGSPALAYRAAQLTADRNREMLAASIERVLETARRPALGLTSAIAPHRDAVAAASRLLIEVESILRSKTPVYSQGVAMLERLLTDSASSLYAPDREGALNQELKAIVGALEGRRPTW
jgi:hypothetical protein